MNALPLFENVQVPERGPKPDPVKERRRVMEAAFEHADERWKAEYEAFILRWLERHGRGTAEEIRTAYEAAGLPAVSKSKRASGGIFVRLRRRGQIREVGKVRSKIYGNDLAVYSLASSAS